MSTVRVLLVDDSLEFLEAAAQFLSQQGRLTIVGWAASGDEALELLDRLRPDLVLIDLVMPGMNGLEATRQIKARPAPPRVVIMTLYDVVEYREAASAAAADGFVAKSSIIPQLMPLITHLFAENVPI
jgi:DNA-binding NarL/FixJ family response regulator